LPGKKWDALIKGFEVKNKKLNKELLMIPKIMSVNVK
jgi:hypothetical protein